MSGVVRSEEGSRCKTSWEAPWRHLDTRHAAQLCQGRVWLSAWTAAKGLASRMIILKSRATYFSEEKIKKLFCPLIAIAFICNQIQLVMFSTCIFPFLYACDSMYDNFTLFLNCGSSTDHLLVSYRPLVVSRLEVREHWPWGPNCWEVKCTEKVRAQKVKTQFCDCQKY